MSALIDPQIHGALMRLARVFGKTLTDDDLEAYGDALDDLPTFDVARACHDIARHERYFPRPVVVRSYVQRLQRERVPKPAPPIRETYTDPRTGERVELWSCAACQDKGVVPVTEVGAVISWDAVRGVGAHLYNPIAHHHVKRCTTCNKLRAPSKPVTRATYDDEHTPEGRR